MFDTIATIVTQMRVPTEICNSDSAMDWRLKKAAELGYRMAMGQFINTANTYKNTWK